jgi:cytoskeletal protein RodZ
MPPDDPKTGDIKPVPMTLSVRARRRNLRALLTAFGLLTVATILTALLVVSFGGLGDSTTVAGGPSTTRIRVIAVTSTTQPPTTTTTTIPPTTTTSTSTTLPTTTTKPKVTTTTKPKVTTTTVPPVSATVSVDNTHQFCTVTVRLSTGAHQSYPLDAYLSQPGDKYVFTAELGGYKVDVTTTVMKNGKCEATLSHFVRA